MTIKELAAVMDAETTMHVMIGADEIVLISVDSDKTLLDAFGDVVVDKVRAHAPDNCTVHVKVNVVRKGAAA